MLYRYWIQAKGHPLGGTFNTRIELQWQVAQIAKETEERVACEVCDLSAHDVINQITKGGLNRAADTRLQRSAAHRRLAQRSHQRQTPPPPLSHQRPR